MAKLTIINFIQNQRNKGLSDEKIRNELTDKGWPVNDVNDGFKEANSNRDKKKEYDISDEWNQRSEIPMEEYDVSSYFMPPKPDENPGEYETPKHNVSVESVFLTEEQEKKISEKLSGVDSNGSNDNKQAIKKYVNDVKIGSNELSVEQKELLEDTITDFATAGATPSNKIKSTEIKYLLPAIPLFFFGGLIGAIIAVGVMMRVKAIIKNPDLDKQEKNSKVIQTYILIYSIGLILFAITAAGGMLALIQDLFGIQLF